MTTSVDSLLDINLDSQPNLVAGDIEELKLIFEQVYNAIQILQNEVERIRIATGTAPPP